MTDDRWPKPLRAAAYHGVLGDIVRRMEPQTEADPAAVLMSVLVMFGNCIGRTPGFRVSADVHHLNLFAVIVGTTAKSRKGMSRSQAAQVFELVDTDWTRTRITSGLSSGEGLIWAVRDAVEREEPVKDKKTGEVIRREI